MDEKTARVPADRRISALAERQYGVVSRAQLLALDLSRGQIDTRLRRGLLHRLHRGVYAVGHTRPRGLAWDLAAVLACGTGAALSHRSAAALWCIRPSSAPVVDVTVPGYGGREQRKGIRLHRARLAPDEVAVRRRDRGDHARPDPRGPRRRPHSATARARLRRGGVPSPRLHGPPGDPGQARLRQAAGCARRARRRQHANPLRTGGPVPGGLCLTRVAAAGGEHPRSGTRGRLPLAGGAAGG